MNFFFRIAPTDETESIEFVEVMKWVDEHNPGAAVKTLGVIYENSEFGKHAAEEAIKAAAGGFELVADIPFNPGAMNLDSEVQTLKSKNPDVVFGACLGADYSLWVRTMKKMNWIPKIALNYCTRYQDPVIAKQLGDDANYFL